MKDGSKGSQAENLVIGAGRASEGFFTPKDDVATALSLNYETNPLQGFEDDFLPGE